MDTQQTLPISCSLAHFLFSFFPSLPLSQGGTERLMDSLASQMNSPHDYSFFLNAVHCLRLRETSRTGIGSILYTNRVENIVFSILFARRRLVSLLRPRRHVLNPADVKGEG